MASLKSITLYNSYFKGKKTRIDCDGHTMVSGNNGAGKTSALRLIPMFFGAEPRQVLSRSGNKLNFVDYYLPNNQSMIVFEYERTNGETCCVALYRPESSVKTGHVYRFVMGKASDSIFHPELSARYKDKEPAYKILSSGLRQVGVASSNQINTTSNYRDILFNTVPMGKNSGPLRGESSRFRIGNPEDRIKHLHDLTTVSMNYNQLISRLREMIIDTHLLVDTKPEGANSQNASTWRDLEGLWAFEAKRNRLDKGIEKYHELMSLRQLLGQYSEALEANVEGAKERLEAMRSEIEDKTQERDDLSEAYKANHRDQQVVISDLQVQLDTLNRELTKIQEKKQQWEDMQIEDISLRFAGLSRMRNKLDLLKEEIKNLGRAGQEVRDAYEQERADAMQRHQAALAAAQAQKDELESRVSKVKDRHSEELDSVKNEFDLYLQGYIDEMDAYAATLREDKDTLVEQVHSDAQPTKDEERDIEQSAALVTKADCDADNAVEKYQEAMQEYDTAKRDLEQAERAEEKLSAVVDKAVERETEAHKRRYVDDGTLLSHLRDNHPGWEENIGRVIRPELLHRKGLLPSSESGKLLYGLQIELGELTPVDEALDVEELDALLAQAQTDLAEAREAHHKALETVHICRSKSTACESLARAATRNLSDVKVRQEQVRKDHQDLLELVAKRGEQRAEPTKKRLEDVKNGIKNTEVTKKNAIKTLKDGHAQKLADLKKEHQSEMTARQHDVSRLNDQMVGLKGDHENHLSALRDTRDKALTEKGIDGESYSRLNSEAESLSQEILDLEAKQNLVTEYATWQEHELPRIGSLQLEIGQFSRQHREAKSSLEALDKAYQLKDEELRVEIEATNKNAKMTSRTINAWESTLGKASRTLDLIPKGDLEPLADSPLGNGEQVAARVQELTEKGTNFIRSLLNTSSQCREIISGHPGTNIYDTWDMLYTGLIASGDFEKHPEKLAIASMKTLSELLNERIPEFRKTLAVQFRKMADVMVKHHQSLSNLNADINRINRTLKTKLNTDHNFAQITDIEVKLTSVIAEDEQWKPLTHFVKAWEKWQQVGDPSGLPSDQVLSDLRSLDEAYRNGRTSAVDLRDLINIEIQITEKDRVVPIRSDKDLENSSSGGLSVIAVLIIFSGLTRYLCPNEEIAISWPIDELGRIDQQNVEKLLDMMTSKNINIFTAQPHLSPSKMRKFKNQLTLHEKKGVINIVADETKPINSGLSAALRLMKGTKA